MIIVSLVAFVGGTMAQQHEYVELVKDAPVYSSASESSTKLSSDVESVFKAFFYNGQVFYPFTQKVIDTKGAVAPFKRFVRNSSPVGLLLEAVQLLLGEVDGPVRAEAVVGGLLVGNPRAQRFVDGVLESAGAGLDGMHLGAEDALANPQTRNIIEEEELEVVKKQFFVEDYENTAFFKYLAK